MATEHHLTIQEERKRRETIYWAVVLIWAGLVFGAESLRLLPQVGQADAWNWVFFGAGLLTLLWAIRRAAVLGRSDPTASLWNFVWGGILIILGLSGLTIAKIGVPLVLLLIGIALLGTTRLQAD